MLISGAEINVGRALQRWAAIVQLRVTPLRHKRASHLTCVPGSRSKLAATRRGPLRPSRRRSPSCRPSSSCLSRAPQRMASSSSRCCACARRGSTGESDACTALSAAISLSSSRTSAASAAPARRAPWWKSGQRRRVAERAEARGEVGALDELLVGDDVEVERAQRQDRVDEKVAVVRVRSQRVVVEREPEERREEGERARRLERRELVAVQVEDLEGWKVAADLVALRERGDAVARRSSLRRRDSRSTDASIRVSRLDERSRRRSGSADALDRPRARGRRAAADDRAEVGRRGAARMRVWG